MGELFLGQSPVNPLKHAIAWDHTLRTFLELILAC